MAEWTHDDEVAAEREGWAIFECSGSENGPWQIQRFDEPADWSGSPAPYPFATDEDAWRHVRSVESELHARALAFLAAENPAEHAAIMALPPD